MDKLSNWRCFLRSAWLRWVACWGAYCYIRLVYLANRWSVEGDERPRRLIGEGRSFIVAFWHGRLLMMPLGWHRHRMVAFRMLISSPRAGRIIAGGVPDFALESLARAASSGGSRAPATM